MFDRYAKDAIYAMGLKRATSDWMPRVMAGFGIGILVGAGVALMLAPKRGIELRTDLVEGAGRLFDKGREQLEHLNNSKKGNEPPHKYGV